MKRACRYCGVERTLGEPAPCSCKASKRELAENRKRRIATNRITKKAKQ